MPKFEVKPIRVKKMDLKKYDGFPSPLPKPPLSMSIVARCRAGKSCLVCSLLINGGMANSFSEVLIISETVVQDKTYAPLAKFDNVSVHDIKQHPIDNELLEAIWERQKQRIKEDPKNDLFIIFDDIGN